MFNIRKVRKLERVVGSLEQLIDMFLREAHPLESSFHYIWEGPSQRLTRMLETIKAKNREASRKLQAEADVREILAKIEKEKLEEPKLDAAPSEITPEA